MSFEIKKADRGDICEILSMVYENPPVIDGRTADRFDEILSQTGFSLLLAKKDGQPVGILSVTVIDGIGKQFPFAVTDRGRIKRGFEQSGAAEALMHAAEYEAARRGCKRIAAA